HRDKKASSHVAFPEKPTELRRKDLHREPPASSLGADADDPPRARLAGDPAGLLGGVTSSTAIRLRCTSDSRRGVSRTATSSRSGLCSPAPRGRVSPLRSRTTLRTPRLFVILDAMTNS